MITIGRSPASRVRRQRAFVLLEVMITLGLLGAFLLVVFRLISLTLHVSSETSRAEQAHRSLDAAVDRLRRDVWAADRVDVPDAATVSVRAADGATFTWRVEQDGLLARDEARPGAAAGRAQWPGMGKGVTFRAADGGLAVDLAEARGHDRGTLRLISQRAAAAAAEGRP